MAEPNDSQLINVTPVWSLNGEIAVTNLWYRENAESSMTVAQLEDLADTVATGIDNALQTFQSLLVDLIRTEARQYRSTGTQVVGIDTSSNYTGTNGNAMLPHQVAVVATLGTGFAGRAWRGRNYWPGFTEADNDGTGTPSAALLAAVEAAYLTNILIGALDLNLVLLSRSRDTWNEIQTIVARTPFATMRSRRPS